MLCLSCNLVSLPQILVLVVGGIKHWSCFYFCFVGLVICIFFLSKIVVFSNWLVLQEKKRKKENCLMIERYLVRLERVLHVSEICILSLV